MPCPCQNRNKDNAQTSAQQGQTAQQPTIARHPQQVDPQPAGR